MGRYVEPLRDYLRVFGRERVLVMLHEDLRDDPDGVWRRCCSFLGIGQSRGRGDQPEAARADPTRSSRAADGRVRRSDPHTVAADRPRSRLLAVK
jgi:hypothetical protein